MDVSIVITCWNGRKLLEKNLPSLLLAAKNPKNLVGEVLVVDDFSTDDSLGYLKKNFPEVRIVRHERNFGYSATCNTGIRQAKGDLVVILNLDVAPASDFLQHSLPHFKDSKVFAVTFNEGKFGPGKLIWKNGFLEIEPTSISSKTSLTDWPSGGSSIFRKDVWQKLGGMDELFLPFYFEDIDLGIRAYKAGYKCFWEPKSKVIHEHEATINPKNINKRYIDSIKQRNHLLLTWKNIDNANLFFTHIYHLFKRILWGPVYLRIILLALQKLGVLLRQKKINILASTTEILSDTASA